MTQARSGSRSSGERGAAAVEFAIILPLLLLIIAALVDLGRLMYTQAIITNAAREGVRMVALGYSQADASQRARDAGIGLSPSLSFGFAPGACPAAPSATSSITMTVTEGGFTWVLLGDFAKLIGFTMPTPQPTAQANMRCSG